MPVPLCSGFTVMPGVHRASENPVSADSTASVELLDGLTAVCARRSITDREPDFQTDAHAGVTDSLGGGGSPFMPCVMVSSGRKETGTRFAAPPSTRLLF